jgi:glycosyltransferase involved in cell wall biosynthesis
VAGGAAIQLDAKDGRAWAEALAAAAAMPEWIRDLRQRARERASEFSWHATAQRTREVYKEALLR